LASCSSSSVPPSGSPTSTSTTTSPTTTAPSAHACGVVASPDIVLTPGTEPCALTTHVGVTVHISLDVGFNWSDPRSDSPVVQVAAIQHPAGGGLESDLRAAAVGQATVTATGTVACGPGKPCPMLARLWSLRITVVPNTPPPNTVTVTEANTGHTVTLHMGDGLDVELSGPTIYTWTEPTTSDAAVLQRVSGSSGTTASGSFLAVAAGSAQVTATENPNCYPECLAPSRVFEVTVTVAP
jgi:hypothetical protein